MVLRSCLRERMPTSLPSRMLPPCKSTDSWQILTLSSSILPRAQPPDPKEPVQDFPALLKYLPVKKETFKDIVNGLSLHPSLSMLVNHGSPAVSRILYPDRRGETSHPRTKLPAFIDKCHSLHSQARAHSAPSDCHDSDPIYSHKIHAREDARNDPWL